MLRLRDDPAGGSLLARQLQQPGRHPGRRAAPPAAGRPAAGTWPGLLWQHITQVTGPQLLPAVAGYFGLAFLRGVTVFTLVDLVNALGIGVFDGGRVDAGQLPAP